MPITSNYNIMAAIETLLDESGGARNKEVSILDTPKGTMTTSIDAIQGLEFFLWDNDEPLTQNEEEVIYTCKSIAGALRELDGFRSIACDAGYSLTGAVNAVADISSGDTPIFAKVGEPIRDIRGVVDKMEENEESMSDTIAYISGIIRECTNGHWGRQGGTGTTVIRYLSEARNGLEKLKKSLPSILILYSSLAELREKGVKQLGFLKSLE